MKSPVFLALLLTAPAFAAEVAVPVPLPAARYAKMEEKSPFTLATKVEAAPAAQPGFAANWTVAGLGRLGDMDFVTIKARDQSTQFSLYGHETNPENGVSVASINWSDVLGKTTVIVKKGTETAKLEFNEADFKGPAMPATPGAATTPPRPGFPSSSGSVVPRPGMPTSPGVVVPRPAAVPPQLPTANLPPVTGNQNPSTSSPNENRRRTRIIAAPTQ